MKSDQDKVSTCLNCALLLHVSAEDAMQLLELGAIQLPHGNKESAPYA